MTYKQRLTPLGLFGAALFGLGTPISFMIQLNTVAGVIEHFTNRYSFGDPPSLHPVVLLLLWAAPFIGLTMLIIGREYYTEKPTEYLGTPTRTTSGDLANIPSGTFRS